MATGMDNRRLWLRIPEAAARLGLGRSTFYELVRAGAIPTVRVGKAVRIPVSSLERWAEAQAEEGSVCWERDRRISPYSNPNPKGGRDERRPGG